MASKLNALKDDEHDDFFLPDLCAIQSVFILILVAELLAIVLVLASGPLYPFDWSNLAFTSLFCQWAMLTCAGLLCLSRVKLREMSRAWAAFCSYGLILIDIFVFSVLGQWFLSGAYLGDPLEFWHEVDMLEILRNLCIGAIIGGLILRYFIVQEQLKHKQSSELNARIQALQSRIRPHFLFNSMNIIASLIPTEPDTAEQVVEDLSALFRASLDEMGNEVTVISEVSLCRRYLGIEKLRLGDRLQVEWDVDEIPAAVKIPMLTLQPLLENSIYHGIQPLLEGGIIKVAISYREQFLYLSVTNPVSPSKHDHVKGNRMAVENIRHRIKALYGDEAHLETESYGNTFTTVISYPYPLEEKDIRLPTDSRAVE
ncbi:MAG: histidine kinase [Gammaproteobacteria bacterium]|nr:MAG: histidine kinase [Gammaproteobacteria bacterium]